MTGGALERGKSAAEMIPLTDLAFNILVALKGEALHGYALIHQLRERTGRDGLRTGTVYAALSRLQDDGLVEEAHGEADGGDSRRRYYRVTTLGLEAARLEAARLSELLQLARNKDLLADGSAG